MNKRLLLLSLVVMLFAGVSVLVAQDASQEDQPPNCPVFEGQPKDVRTSYYMGEGIAYLNSNQLGNAEFSFTCVIRVVDPSYVMAYMTRAVVYTRQRSYDLAIKDYTKAIELDSKRIEAYNNRGVLYTATQDYKSAGNDFNQAIDLNADYIPAYQNLAVLAAIQRDYDGAITLLNTAIKRSGIGDVLTKLRDPNRPSDAPPIEYDPLNARAYALLGIVYSAKSLDSYNDYLFLAGGSADQRIQTAAGALESRFTFETRLDDGTWMLTSDFSPTG